MEPGGGAGPRAADDTAELVAGARRGEARAVARLISLVEDESPRRDAALREVSAALAPHTGRAHIVGITGSPGVGKSTSTSALVTALRAQDRRVGVLAVDPTSPFSGGALLGDRVRMQEHVTDDGVYIRSMASRGHLGGLAGAAPQALRVLDAAGCDVILVETVGVGQSEVEIAGLADTTLVLVAPGMGDGIQALKAGILEIGDLFVVNKADREGANTTRREIRSVVSARDSDWTTPIVLTVATTGEGVGEVVTEIERHWEYLAGGELERRRLARIRREIEALAVGSLRRRMGDVTGDARLGSLAADVLAGRSDPFAAADTLIEHL
jgi:LAO/AO transport system kinase